MTTIFSNRALWRFRGTLSPCLLVSLSLLTTGCDAIQLPGRPDPADRPVPAEDTKNPRKLFSIHCAGCHGEDGKLGPAPPLNDPLFLALIPDEELLRVIAEGRPGTPMPAWDRKHGGPLSAEQVRALAGDIKPRWKDSLEKPDTETPPYLPPGGKSVGDREAGAKVFATACAGCHGEDGRGTEQVGAVHDAAFLALLSDQALRRLIITGRPDLDPRMPAFNGTGGRSPGFKPLTSADVGDLVALLASWRGGPPPGGK